MATSGLFRVSGLWPPFQEAVRYLAAWADYYGLQWNIREGYRDAETQARYYAQGRTADEIARHVKKHFVGGAVTDAPPWQSPHQYGLAIDGEGRDFDQVKQLAVAMGFGTVPGDYPHLEWPGWRSLLQK